MRHLRERTLLLHDSAQAADGLRDGVRDTLGAPSADLIAMPVRLRSAIFGLVLAICLVQADASDNLAVKGEVSPKRVTAATMPKLRLAQLGALDTALAITLPPLGRQQRSAMTEVPGVGPLRIGFHRDLPTEYQGDLTPRLRWVTDPDDGSMVAAATVTSPAAVRVRLAIRAELPPGAQIRFFGGEPPEIVGVVDRSDLSYSAVSEGSEPLWSPSVPGATIGLEITLPSSDARGQTLVVIDRVSHQFRPINPIPAADSQDANGAIQTRSHLECRHVDIRCRNVGRMADAVARITYEDDGTYVCSGTLMNDRDSRSDIPYFLTAHHCVSTQAVASTVEARWFFQRGFLREHDAARPGRFSQDGRGHRLARHPGGARLDTASVERGDAWRSSLVGLGFRPRRQRRTCVRHPPSGWSRKKVRRWHN